ncbi:hypothetical protein [Serinibacter salmoneus]|uniref:Uncharacterized protein n=1 Tax=Serinibacter salmoneus TaxID=556530 RepID=A0A2A9D202_9MICO|nr:hypothetical protein [Serinibacter salmoneus]PFG19880.1 hypothetical protein ATL40_1456 [Serinibacter salmoneus]
MTLHGELTNVNRRIDDLARSLPRYRFATITATAPVRVRLDGDSEPLPITPPSLVDHSTLTIGDRVAVRLHSGQLLLEGRVYS